MRYEKVDNLVQLALEMQAARHGLSLDDIAHKFNVSRRTAMRMRDSVLRNFPQTEEKITDERTKRWTIPPGTLDRLINFTADELALLETACRLLERENRKSEADNLVKLSAKIKTFLKPNTARRMEYDLEALLEIEGLAMRPGPRPRIGVAVIEELRDAMRSFKKVRILHKNRQTQKLAERLVHPYGFLHGHRNYLVGWHENPKANKVALFALPYIEKVDITDEIFERDPDFNLDDFAARSFGLFQGEPFDTVWRFSPEVTKAAEEFIFHPSQQIERQDDGSLLVKLRASGDVEMAWYLYCWGDKVEVLEPKRLAEMVNGNRVSWPALP